VRLFHRIEVGTLEVLDEGDRKLIPGSHLADDGWYVIQAGQLRGADPAFTGHQLVAVHDLGDENGLQDAVHGDACGQLLESLLFEALSGLVGVAANA
jgi:hypothetical protein